MQKLIGVSAKIFIVLAFFGCSSKPPNQTDEELPAWQAVNGNLQDLNVQAVAADPTQPGILYASTFAGMYKSEDGGLRWFSANNGMTSNDVRCIEISPQNTKVVFVGTWGKGIFKTDDAGRHWRSVSSGLKDPRILGIFIPAKLQNTIWAATEGGVFRSNDSGASWSAVAFNPLSFRRIYIIAGDPTGVNLLALANYDGFFLSEDGGKNWRDVNQDFIDVSESRPTKGALSTPWSDKLLFIDRWANTIYLSSDNGKSWKLINNKIGSSEHVVVWQSGSKAICYSLLSGVMQRSDDWGKNWTIRDQGLPSNDVRDLELVGDTLYAAIFGKGIYALQIQ